jgi:monoterpene epsilon-lactone hydrolase
MKSIYCMAGVAGMLALTCGVAPAQQASSARPTFADDGTVHVPAFDLPPSALSSPEAQGAQKMRAHMPTRAPSSSGDIVAVRESLEKMLAPQLAAVRQQFPVDVIEQTIAGVPTRVVTPIGKPVDAKRVLINLHGGGFSMCATGCALIESAPIASVGGFKVITVNYRQGPEAQHPAALEDVEKVYRELLKSYPAKHIGLFGCSAGGALTAQSAAWMPAHQLPQFGAIGIFGAGAVRFGAGDSAYVAGYIDGSFPPPNPDGSSGEDMSRGYFAKADMKDSIISAALHPEVLKQFPPSLIITGTRAMDMSPAIFTNTQLLKAGVRSTLVVGEGMGHCFVMQSNLPEAQDAYRLITRFFKENLQ